MIIGGIVVFAGAALSHAAPDTPADRQGSTSQTTRSFTLDLAERLRTPETVRQRQMEVLNQLEEMSDRSGLPERLTLDEIHALLFKVNDALATAAPLNATRWLLGLEQADDPTMLARLTRAGLAASRTIHEALKARPDGPREHAREVTTALETLDLFLGLFDAMFENRTEEARQNACREAAMRMAELREHRDAAVAASALLWQAMAWELAGRRDRALTSLPEALEKPQQLPYDFLARLLRCRMLADAGQHAAAAALTIRIRQECDDWFGSRKKDAARRLAALVQCRITQQWVSRISPTSQPASDQLMSMLTALQTEFLAEGAIPDLYQLDKMIPLLISAPKITLPRRPATEPSPGTATQSASTRPTEREHEATATSSSPSF